MDDNRFYEWNEIKDENQWSGLLLGNGASIAVWENFRYSSIYERATSVEHIEHPLGEQEVQLFDALETTNFEQIMSSLSTAQLANHALGIETPRIQRIYQGVQTALVEAVRSVHIPWATIPQETLVCIREELLNYSYVYSTNYDLLIYWAIMASPNGSGFRDYYWDESFDPGNTEIWGKVTKVLYLHGGLHLYRTNFGNILKRRARDFKNLLELFGAPYGNGAVPLFITEGNSKQKLSSIYRSDYLSFAYSKFSNHDGDLVVFGHSLDESDAHLFIINDSWKGRKIAVAFRPGTNGEIKRKMARARHVFPEAYLVFYNSETHPLGARELRVEHSELEE